MSKRLITELLKETEAQVLQRFTDLPNAVVSNHQHYVFVPGSRADRALLVAHADTVNTKKGGITAVNPVWQGDICLRDDAEILGGRGYGGGVLGGDDRAGCAALVALWNGEHSLLVTTGEERGCIGAAAAANEIPKLLQEHSFCVEFDRLGKQQAVFYDISTDEFEAYVLKSLGAEWDQYIGSYTDVRKICPVIKRCGVNVSIGYTRQHTANEAIYYPAWLQTVTDARRWLTEKLETFELKVEPAKSYHPLGMLASAEKRWSRWWDEYNEEYKRAHPQEGKATASGSSTNGRKMSKNAVKKARKQILRLRKKAQITEREAHMALLKLGLDPLEYGIMSGVAVSQTQSRAVVPVKAVEAVTVMCYHTCRTCVSSRLRPTGTWVHKRPEKKGAAASSVGHRGAYGCTMSYECLCPKHSTVTAVEVDATSEWWCPARLQ